MGDETITESDIWADIDAVFNMPQRMEGDIDTDQIMAHYGLSRNGAHNRMEALARTGKWEVLTVADDSSATGKRKVIRRISRV